MGYEELVAGAAPVMAKILIVDDSASSRAIISILLGYQDHLILEAGDGNAGLGIVRAERPDLIILDLDMPGMNGAAFMQQLRADPVSAATRVIFYTGSFEKPFTKTLAASCGVRTVLSKPTEVDALITAVDGELKALAYERQD
ncbi:MAG: response regulator [Rhodospirillaceae bacterium]|nr:MAG: response regulator [Rhodospirillaceae bacterium]